MLQENNVTLRFHGRGRQGRRTVAVDGSKKTWLLPDHGTDEGQVGDAIESGLRKTELGSLLEAQRADDLSQRATVQDLLDSGWKQLVYEIEPPQRLSARGSGKTQQLYFAPATGQVLQISGFPAADQKCYSDWLVPGIDYWSEDTGGVDELTVAEIIKAFAPAAVTCMPGSRRKAHAGNSAGQTTAAGAAAPGQASGSQSAAKRKAEDSLLEEQQQVKKSTASQQGSSAATSRHSYQAAMAAGQIATLLASKEPLDEQQIHQLLRLVVSYKCDVQQVLERLQQHNDQQAFMAFAVAAIRKRRADMLLAALAADCGRLMQHFLQSLSSSNVEISAAAAEVLAEFTEVVHAGQFIASVLETQQGIELLAQAVLPPDSSAAVAEGARAVSERFSELVRAAPAAVVPKEHRDTSTKVVRQCVDLLNPGRRHMSGTSSNQQLPESASGRRSVLVALLLLALARGNTKARTALLCTVEPLMAAIVTATAGPYQTLCLAGLSGVVKLRFTEAHVKLAPCGLALLAGFLTQQEPEVSLAASILRKADRTVGPAHLPGFCSQLAQAATSSSTAAGSLTALDLLLSIAHAHHETVLPHLDAALCALVQLTSTAAWHSSMDAKACVEQGLHWLCILADASSTKPPLTATPQRVRQLAAVVLHTAKDSGMELTFTIGLQLSCLAGVLMKHLGISGLLALQPDMVPLTGTKCQLLGPGSCWLQSWGAILHSLQHEWQSYQPALIQPNSPMAAYFQQRVMDALDRMGTLAEWLSELHKPATPAETPTATKAATLSLAELENLGASQLLLQALFKCAGLQESVPVAMKAFACLRLLVSIPGYALAVAAHYQDWEATATSLQSKITNDEQQQLCLNDLAAVKKCITDLQERIAASSAHAKSGLELAMRDCALEHQNFRVDHYDSQRQLSWQYSCRG